MDKGSLKIDILIIGGGLMGCSCAYQLAKSGKKVILFESRNIASGASGRNGGQALQLEGRDSNPESIIRRLTYTTEGNRMLENLGSELDIDLEYHQCGSLDLACTEEERDELKKLVNIQHQAGDTEIKWLTKDEVKEFCPSLTRDIFGARFRPTDGVINPFWLTYGFAKGARRYGAQIFTHTKVEEILIENSQVKGVRTPKGLFRAPIVVNATNAWASFLTKGINIFPLRMVAAVSERIPELQVCPLEAEINGEALFTTTQTKSGNVLVGGLGTEARKRLDQYDVDVRLAEVRRCTSIISRFFPSLAHINIIRAWSGTMAITVDGLPCIGPVPGVEGLILVAGFSNGMVYAPIVGKLVAEYITENGNTSLSLNIFDPARFYKKGINWPEFYNYTILERFLGRL